MKKLSAKEREIEARHVITAATSKREVYLEACLRKLIEWSQAVLTNIDRDPKLRLTNHAICKRGLKTLANYESVLSENWDATIHEEIIP